jgi:hypothetical protein
MVIAWRIIILLSLLSFLLVSCSNPHNSLSKLDIELTAEDNEEAELIALCLSGELVSPYSLSNQVLMDLANIRSAYGDKFEPIQRIRFGPPWVPGCLLVGFDSSTAEMVANGEYHAWDWLNIKYQVTEIDTMDIRNNWIVLYFKDKLHPQRLSELYTVLPGITYAEPNGFYGDFSNVYPRQIMGGISYLFREGWGDCPCGCTNNRYWYFVVELNRHRFIGYWFPDEDPIMPPWWEEAKRNIDQFRLW